MSKTQTIDDRYSRTIAQFVADLRYEAIPQEVRERMKLLLLDAFGCGLYGAALDWSRSLQRACGSVDDTRKCTIWGTSQKLSAPSAALINGTQVQGFELDDANHRGVVHLGAATLSPLVALAESRGGMSGRDLIVAAVAGYEIGSRVGICMTPDHIGQGWHPAGTVGIFAAACGSARAIGLDASRTQWALGHAGSQASGLMAAQYGAMIKRVHAGHAAECGMMGALFAEEGLTGIVNVFESEYGGFLTTYSRSNDRFRIEELCAGLGTHWETMNVSLKFYACVFSGHTALDAIREIQQERPFGPADVERIVVHGSKVTMDHVGWKYRPEGMTSAQLNLPFCIATLLLEGDVFVDQFTPESIHDAQRIALADRVKVIEDAAITARGARYRHMVRVEVFFKDGGRLERTVEVSRGSEKRFAPAADIVAKYEKLVRHVLPTRQMDALREAVLDLERLDDAVRLGPLLARGRGALDAA
ncbi:MmgE/PrpD family protein [Verticiella sediminum]|uniref:MmgE/PrpD family protein n=1 Tax=Verticiella sediminum TaxID=1247510 RepID=A0A556AJN4_9BURK|nr:MmgE/PrpD family protein [Verticiella sediminum]TSH93083.1 MmgE/PrpD family protein [Verticiella sediminum]